MDPIQPNQPIQGPQEAEKLKPQEAEAPEKPFDVNAGATAPTDITPVESTAPVEPPTDAGFEAMRERITSMHDAGASEDEILQGLVEDEVRNRFGTSLDDQVVERISESIRSDPSMSSLFRRLVDEALPRRSD